MAIHWLRVCLVGVVLVAFGRAQDCVKRIYDEDNSFVCVCNATFCDFAGDRPVPMGLNYTRIVSSKAEHRFLRIDGQQETIANGTTVINVEHSLPEEQVIQGFGGAFTDSTGMNIRNLSAGAQDLLMRSYFAPEGIEYNLCRVPIAGTDFSVRPYSYDDVPGDVNLTYFSLTEEDYLYKIPLIQTAFSLSGQEVKIFGSPWAPPAWMKTNGEVNGNGTLFPDMWIPYANYLVRFIEDYENEGIPIWGLTPQNEPLTGFSDHPWNTCGWTAEDMRDWIKTTFGPIMSYTNHGDVVVMVFDHNRDAIPSFPATILRDADASKYVHGTAVHWYNDFITGPEVLNQLHGNFTDKFILYTESCTGWSSPPAFKVILGSWQRAENYAFNILEDLNHHSVGWVDWNMALDMDGGPNWADNVVDAPIIIDQDNDEFLKQPMFYAMGHFSKHVLRDARRIVTSVMGSDSISAAAFHNPDGEEVVVILNSSDLEENVSITSHLGEYINILVNPKSIETVIYQSFG